jgi:hypothetical protein
MLVRLWIILSTGFALNEIYFFILNLSYFCSQFVERLRSQPSAEFLLFDYFGSTGQIDSTQSGNQG